MFSHPELMGRSTNSQGGIMSTRLAAVASLDDQRPVGPVYRSIIALDLEESTMRTNPVKGELRRVMYDLLLHSLEAVAITGNRLEPLTDRGDGVQLSGLLHTPPGYDPVRDGPLPLHIGQSDVGCRCHPDRHTP